MVPKPPATTPPRCTINWAEGQAPSTVNDSGPRHDGGDREIPRRISRARSSPAAHRARTRSPATRCSTRSCTSMAGLSRSPRIRPRHRPAPDRRSRSTSTASAPSRLRFSPAPSCPPNAGAGHALYRQIQQQRCRVLSVRPRRQSLQQSRSAACSNSPARRAPNSSFVLPFGQAISRHDVRSIFRDGRHHLRRR